MKPNKLIKKSNAYWINPQGEILYVSTSHIAAVIRTPEYFGVSRDGILESYRRHNEKLGVEGNARIEILTEILKQGWVRIRLHPRSNVYTIEFWKLEENIKSVIFSFCKNLTEAEIIGSHAGIRILEASIKKAQTVDIDEILKQELFPVNKNFKLRIKDNE